MYIIREHVRKLYNTLLQKGGYGKVMRVRCEKIPYACTAFRRVKTIHLDPLVQYDRHTK